MKNLPLVLAILFSLLSLSAAAEAEKIGLGLLTPKQIRALIGDFPAKGSAGEAKDDATLLKWQSVRTKKECDFAASQSRLNVEKVFVKPVGPLEDHEFDSLKLKLLKLEARTGTNSLLAKRLYNRPRPYVRNHNIKPCIPLESSSSYPSGHAAMGMATGKLLAHYFPEHAEEIMQVALQVGTNRIIGGVHHPTDVEAGRKLGEELALYSILDTAE